jgi:hypothetical protein
MATSSKIPAQLQETFQFRPRWWWDPVPDWVISHLTPEVVRELGTLQIEAQRTVLKAQLEALDKSLVVLNRKK